MRRPILWLPLTLLLSIVAAVAVAQSAPATTPPPPTTAGTPTGTAPTTTATTPTNTSTAPTTTSGTSTAPPAAGPAQNVVVDNNRGGTVDARAGLQVARTDAKSASPTNLARANAHDCASPCQAIAAAFQIVLVTGGASTQAPQNVALATNINCDHCGSFAYAYQYVVEISRGVKLSSHAHQQIVALRKEADTDLHAGLAYPTLDAKLHDLAGRFRAAIDNDLTQQHVGEQHKQSFQTVKPNPAT